MRHIILIFALVACAFFVANADSYRFYYDERMEYVIDNAEVYVYDDASNLVFKGLTNSEGIAVVTGLDPGTYTGKVIFKGKSYSFILEEMNNPDLVHDIILQP